MAMDRQGTGLTIVRVCLGAFFLSVGLTKYRWFLDGSILARELAGWAASAGPAAMNRQYLEHFAIPGAAYLARLVPIGEICCGAAMLVGFRTPLVAFVAFLMALNFDFASGILLAPGGLTNPYALPVLGATLGLALGGVRLPWSIRP